MSHNPTIRRYWICPMLMLGVMCLDSHAHAQTGSPDIRSIRPSIMLLMDTSGSMEYLPNCVCVTSTCAECLPNCGSADPALNKNRWGNALEALTGSWSSYSCTTRARNSASFTPAMFDYAYYVPYNEPPLATTQAQDGILDSYADRVRFGLMTFDSIGTWAGADPLIQSSAWDATKNTGELGMYSYGPNRQLTFPACNGKVYQVNLGSRSASASMGALKSVGNDTTDPTTASNAVQDALLAVRPYGSTPIAALLDDAKHYFTTDPDVADPVTVPGGDVFYNCRGRYIVMITDGYPDADFRQTAGDTRFRCDAPGTACTDSGGSPVACQCPYPKPEDTIAALCQLDASASPPVCKGPVKGVFVVGFNVATDPATVTMLNFLAQVGGTTKALFAEDKASLKTQLSAVLDQAAPGVTTRTRPTFVSTRQSNNLLLPTATAGQARGGQYQFNTGFQVGTPWTGILERRRIECKGSPATPTEVPLSDLPADGDKFHLVLNARNLGGQPRALYTYLTATPAELNQSIPLTQTSSNPTSLPVVGLNKANTNLTYTYVANSSPPSGFTADTRRNFILDWIHGDTSGVGAYPISNNISVDSDPYDIFMRRGVNRLGSIYHSSPVVVTSPQLDTSDESYNLFRDQIKNRPALLYVGTDDGIMHAFSISDQALGAPPAPNAAAGQELWGFVPPTLLTKLGSAVDAHQLMVDGTPVVRDVPLQRLPGVPTPVTAWRSIMVFGLRGGGPGYVALDVTDPANGPKFLWQLLEPNMGQGFGKPAIGQLLVNVDSQDQERAVAVIPGGTGDAGTGVCPATAAWGMYGSNVVSARPNRKCWNGPTGTSTKGRSLYIVDIQSRRILRTMGPEIFDAPLSGSVSLFPGQTGSASNKAYVTDANGVIWRIDLASKDPNAWSAKPLFDMFYDRVADYSIPAYEPPVLSVDREGNTVLIQATGDIDQLDNYTQQNKVVSLTEKTNIDGATGQLTSNNGVQVKLNWQVALDAGQQVTGPVELFAGNVYFGTFKTTTSVTDACSVGESRIWGADYVLASPETSTNPKPALPDSTDPTGITKVLYSQNALENQIIMGVSITQRPSCIVSDGIDDNFNNLLNYKRFNVTDSSQGRFDLVAQVTGKSGSVATSNNSQIGVISFALTPPRSTTTPIAVAGNVE